MDCLYCCFMDFGSSYSSTPIYFYCILSLHVLGGLVHVCESVCIAMYTSTARHTGRTNNNLDIDITESLKLSCLNGLPWPAVVCYGCWRDCGVWSCTRWLLKATHSAAIHINKALSPSSPVFKWLEIRRIKGGFRIKICVQVSTEGLLGVFAVYTVPTGQLLRRTMLNYIAVPIEFFNGVAFSACTIRITYVLYYPYNEPSKHWFSLP